LSLASVLACDSVWLTLAIGKCRQEKGFVAMLHSVWMTPLSLVAVGFCALILGGCGPI
jgi:hypothetical protein